MFLFVLFFAPKKRTLPFASFRKEGRGAAPMEDSLDDESSIGLEGELGKPFLP